MIHRLKSWWGARTLRRSVVRMEKARRRAQIHRRHRIRLESMYPDRETLPPHVWIREFARHLWYSLALRFYPLAALRRATR